jgi:hypothetical protein
MRLVLLHIGHSPSGRQTRSTRLRAAQIRVKPRFNFELLFSRYHVATIGARR